MRWSAQGIRFSPTDLSNHIACRHQTTLNLAAAMGEIAPFFRHDLRLEALRHRGFEHEQRYIDHLRAQGRSIHVPESDDVQEGVATTIAAMRSGADVIVQPTLAAGRMLGRADVLLRVTTPSDLGAWSYEPVDTKLSRQTKAGTILQLCAYSEIIAELQGVLPNEMHVVTPGGFDMPETYRTREYFAYYRYAKSGLELSVDGAAAQPATYPEPVPHCEVCRWWVICDEQRRADDHLSLVAGITGLQRQELQRRGAGTLESVARLPLPLPWKPSRGSVGSFEKVREQARIQWSSRRSGKPEYELLRRDSERGLARLPAPSEGDVFFDFEGDPFVEPHGLEFLWGWVTRDAEEARYHHRWCFTVDEERAAHEAFIDEMMVRWQRYPDFHIYHYAPYEPAALKRLMSRYASREAEIDRMLRSGIFVDLYAVVRQSLRAGVERYSIKDLEVFFNYTRSVDLTEASRSLRAIEYALEVGDAAANIPESDREMVRGYNADDCHATSRLQGWVEKIRAELVDGGEAIARPPSPVGAAPESVPAWATTIQPVRDALLDGISADSSLRNSEQNARWLLAHMLEFHRREDKVSWWEFFRLADLSEDELLEEPKAIAGLAFAGRVAGTDRAPVHRYTFPEQEISVSEGNDLHISKDEQLGKVEHIDIPGRWVDVKKKQVTCDRHPAAVFARDRVSSDILEKALLRIATWVSRNEMDVDGPYRPALDLLLRRSPRLSGREPLFRSKETTLDAATRVVPLLDRTTLCIQGPPGTGKTYTAARMAVKLVKLGKSVGVCALSHKVIRNLLRAIVQAASVEGMDLQCVQKYSTRPLGSESNIIEVKSNDGVLKAWKDGVRVVGSTAWLWANPDFARSVDVLFLDEAGQFPLPNAVAISQGAQSLVLVGDPQQLEAPLQGAHPPGTDASALHHALGEHKTMPRDLGLFIAETRRLAPRICAFTSEQFYENRLHSCAGSENQMIRGHASIIGAGLWFLPVPHQANRTHAEEEVEGIAGLVGSLLHGTVRWVDSEHKERPLTAADILIVAPYNMQVAALKRRLPRLSIGTVDKFQGQQAPIVIYSMTTSAPEDAPRGMEFLYSLNRLNVATSRARCACILVANPPLLQPECRTPAQMRLANAFCRYLELAQVLPTDGLKAAVISD